MQLYCPFCRQQLLTHAQSNGLYCQNKHHFDPSPEGFYDLIPGKKNPKNSDPRPLLRAKHHFLEAGHLSPLVNSMARLLGLIPAAELVELGCGEGYFGRALAKLLPQWQFVGFDIAPNAIFAAKKAQPEGRFFICDPAKAPLAANSVQTLLVKEQKIKTELLRQYLTQAGHLLLIQTGPRHHWQLRQSLLPAAMEYPLSWPVLEGFTLVEHERCHFNQAVDPALRHFVLQISPLAWRASKAAVDEYQRSGSDELEWDWQLSLWRKEP